MDCQFRLTLDFLGKTLFLCLPGHPLVSPKLLPQPDLQHVGWHLDFLLTGSVAVHVKL